MLANHYECAITASTSGARQEDVTATESSTTLSAAIGIQSQFFGLHRYYDDPASDLCSNS